MSEVMKNRVELYLDACAEITRSYNIFDRSRYIGVNRSKCMSNELLNRTSSQRVPSVLL